MKKACTDKLLQAWLIHYQANILDLLGGLDIMSSGDICEQSVNLILAKAPTEEILEGFDLLNEKLVNFFNIHELSSYFFCMRSPKTPIWTYFGMYCVVSHDP